MTVYRYLDNRSNRAFDIHPDGRMFGFFKDLRYDFAIVEEADTSRTTLIEPGDYDFDVTLGAAEESGDIVIAGEMSTEQLGLWDVAAWFEMFLWPCLLCADAFATSQSFTENERHKSLTTVLVADEIDATIAETIVTNYISTGVKPSFRTLGIADAPCRFLELLEGNIR